MNTFVTVLTNVTCCPPHSGERTTKNNGGHKPDDFEAAYLLHKYRTEFDMLDIPGFVKVVIFPILRLIGGMSGKFEKYQDGPQPVR